LVLSTITWNTALSPAGGSWDTASNWVGGQVPGSTDDAVIDLAGSGTVTLGTGATDAVQSLTTNSNTTINISSDALSLTTISSIAGGLTMSGGTLTGAATLTVSGPTVWTGGEMSGSGTTNANGGLTMGASGTSDQMLLDQRTLNNAGAATLDGTQGLFLSTGATFDNESGASLDLLADVFIINNGGTPAGGNLVNAGTLSKIDGTGVSAISAAPTDTGTVQVLSGTLNIQGTFTNFSSTTSTLAGGTYDVSATLRFSNANIVTNAAAIVLTGAAAQIIDQSSNNALRNFATNTAAGTFAIQGESNLTTSGSFSNAGGVTGGTGSTFTATGAYTQSGGSTNLSGGTLSSTTASVAINGGILGGAGTVSGNVTSGGQVIPGGAGGVGVLNIMGKYTQRSAGSLTINLGGPNAGTGYSQLGVSGLATLDGGLDVNLVNGFDPANDATFQVLNYNPHSGEFASITLENFPDGTTLQTDYTASDLVLTANVAATLTSIAVTPADPSVAKGLSEPFTAIGTFSDGSTANLTNQVTWVSSNTAVASISNTTGSQGLAQTLTQGTTTITAEMGSLEGATTLTVTPAVVASIAVTPADSSVAKGLSQQFTATGTLTDGSTEVLTSSVMWTSANTSIATISGTGLA
jgi:trimeric autotransporter adhesin